MHVNLWAGGPTLALADHWQQGDRLPDEPADTQVFGYKFSDGAAGSVATHRYPSEHAMPLDTDAMIDGLHGAAAVISGDAALIEVDVEETAGGVPYVYSLMKIRQEPDGVQYNLTLHLHGDHIQQIQGFFFEGDVTGMRDAAVYEMARRRDLLVEPTADDPTGGWARDPYSGVKTGFVMNMSELSDFDERLPSHPLSMARELLASVGAS